MQGVAGAFGKGLLEEHAVFAAAPGLEDLDAGLLRERGIVPAFPQVRLGQRRVGDGDDEGLETSLAVGKCFPPGGQELGGEAVQAPDRPLEFGDQEQDFAHAKPTRLPTACEDTTDFVYSIFCSAADAMRCRSISCARALTADLKSRSTFM